MSSTTTKQSPPMIYKLLNTKSQFHLQLYNSVTNRKEVFVPMYGNEVRWYTRGLAFYDEFSIAHARLRDLPFSVQNNSSRNDRVRSSSNSFSSSKIKSLDAKYFFNQSSQFEKRFIRDLNKYDVLPPTIGTRTSDYVKNQ
ncbi:hypothetical protein I4U23_025126 [Adineta vaga]|nr:hypothetical protein I4U23_025126 [Adineta vaga]